MYLSSTFGAQGMLQCSCSGCGAGSHGDAQSCEEQFGKQICDGEASPPDTPLSDPVPRCSLTVLLRDAEMGPLAAVYASAVVLFFILAIVMFLFPCIVFGCAWCTCVSNKQKLVRTPYTRTQR
jgi:hypothetical protein